MSGPIADSLFFIPVYLHGVDNTRVAIIMVSELDLSNFVYRVNCLNPVTIAKTNSRSLNY